MKITSNRLSSIFVLDQDQALDCYAGVLGLEVATDSDLGFLRWLTVRWVAFTTDDVNAVHTELVDQGVQILDAPSDKSYGRDMGLRDPFGNTIRIGTMTG